MVSVKNNALGILRIAPNDRARRQAAVYIRHNGERTRLRKLKKLSRAGQDIAFISALCGALLAECIPVMIICTCAVLGGFALSQTCERKLKALRGVAQYKLLREIGKSAEITLSEYEEGLHGE